MEDIIEVGKVDPLVHVIVRIVEQTVDVSWPRVF